MIKVVILRPKTLNLIMYPSFFLSPNEQRRLVYFVEKILLLLQLLHGENQVRANSAMEACASSTGACIIGNE